MTRPTIIGVIPARLESTRLPGKVLLDVAGKALLQRVYEAVSACPLLDDLVVATDSARIVDFCRTTGIRYLRTGSHNSGTDRLHEVLQKTTGEIYVNVQGDEPTAGPEHLRLLIQPLLQEEAEVSTLCVAIDGEQAFDPNVVKVVRDHLGRALYFSRAPIPYHREQASRGTYFKHIGLYAYRRSALKRFHELSPGRLEQTERLEQLRFLENGTAIAVVETSQDTIGVDTAEDLERAIAYFQGQG